MKNVHLFADGVPSEDELRRAAIALVRYAVDAGGANYRRRGDPVFEEVTEGRCSYSKYSSCGDLCHWLLFRLGVRDERIVNRSTDGGVIPWASGKNLSRLVYCVGKAFVYAKSQAFSAKPGDILYVRYPEHVCVLESAPAGAHLNQPFNVTTCDYGQVIEHAQAGVIRTVPLTQKFVNGRFEQKLGSRELVGWVDISKLRLDTWALLEDWMEAGEPAEGAGEDDA